MALVTFQAGEPLDRFTPVAVSSGGYAIKAAASSSVTTTVAGLTLSSGTTNSQIRVQTDHIVTNMSGLVPNQTYYLGPSSGTIASGYSGWQSIVADQFTSGAYLAPLGFALSTTELSLEIGRPVFINNSSTL